MTCTESLPTLAAGAHLVPEDGACLMEYVSVLAGAPFGDHPRCTDPTLAALARLVNDGSTDEGRGALVTLAPDLAATGPAGPGRTAAVVLATVQSASAAAGRPPALRRELRRAERRSERVAGTGLRSVLARHLDVPYRQGPARRRLEASAAALTVLPGPDRDAALRATLLAAIAAAHRDPRPGSTATRGPQGRSLPDPAPMAGARAWEGTRRASPAHR